MDKLYALTFVLRKYPYKSYPILHSYTEKDEIQTALPIRIYGNPGTTGPVNTMPISLWQYMLQCFFDGPSAKLELNTMVPYL